ncbi:MAG: hypothetical protein AB7S38_22350 [Vulcanimicrobiota bacterium]
MGACCLALLLMLAPVARADSLEEITEQFLTETQPVKRLHPLEYLVPGLEFSKGVDSGRILQACRERPELYRLVFNLLEPTPETQSEVREHYRPTEEEMERWVAFWSELRKSGEPEDTEFSPTVVKKLERHDTRAQAVRVLLAGEPTPERLRPLLPWIEEENWCSGPSQRALFVALQKVRVEEASGPLQRLLESGQSKHLDQAALALAVQAGRSSEDLIRKAMRDYDDGPGFLEALHLLGCLRRDDVVSRLDPPYGSAVARWLRDRKDPPVEVCGWILGALPELERRESYTGSRWITLALQWDRPEVDDFLVARLMREEVTPVGLAGLLSRAPLRPDLSRLDLSGYKWGYVALLSRNEAALADIFGSSDRRAKRAVLAGARRIHYRLPETIVDAALTDPTVVDAAYLYLIGCYEPWAREALKGRAPAGLVLGRDGGAPSERERPFLGELADPEGPRRIVTFFQYWGYAHAETSVIREWGDRASYWWEPDPYRYVVADLQSARLAGLMSLLEEPSTSTLPALGSGWSHPAGFLLTYLTKSERWRIESEVDITTYHPYLRMELLEAVQGPHLRLLKEFIKLQDLGELRYKVIDQKGGRVLKADRTRHLESDRNLHHSVVRLKTMAGNLVADHRGLVLDEEVVAKGYFMDAAVSSDGRWVAASTRVNESAPPEALVLFDAKELAARPARLAQSFSIHPLRYIPELERFLVWCPQRDQPEFFLVNPQTGDWQAAEGELSPYTHSCDFQTSSWPDWVWATRIRQQGDVDVTEVGLYHRYQFVFLPAGTYPHLLAKSNEIEVLPDQRVVRVRLVNDEIELPLDTVPTPTSSWK